MRNKIIALSLLIAAGLFADEDLEINGEFKQLNETKTAPVGWAEPFAGQQGIGTFRVVPAREPDENAVLITAQKRMTALRTTKSFPIRPGNKVRLEADIKGKGTSGIGLALYCADGTHITDIVVAKRLALPHKFLNIKGRCTISREYAVKRNGKTVQLVPASLRVFIFAGRESGITFENVEAEVDSGN